MKKIIFLFLILSLLFSGCSSKNDDVNENNVNVNGSQSNENNSQSNDNAQLDNNEETENDVDKNLVENQDINLFLGQIFELIFPYLENNNMKYYDFKEREKLISYLTYDVYQEALENCCYVEEMPSEGSYMTPNYFHKTLNESIYLYYGDFDENNCPTGTGILFQNVSDYDGNTTLLLRYVGDFSNGLFEGYGIEFDQNMYDKNYNTSSYDIDYYNKNFLYVNAGYLHESYYKEGRSINQSNVYSMNLFESITYAKNPDDITISDLKYSLKSMKYLPEEGIWEYNSYWYGCPQFIGYFDKDGNEIGFGKSYYSYSPNLCYEGDFLNGEYHGKGKKYLENGNLIYEGEFQEGRYHGNGILYDEEGKVLHEGEFVEGDIK